ncbi:MAG: molybdate ABC transporter substrate-binding protein [Rhodovibrionaceae bacterium]|nr:molybdate ABC transporter substrate-binding protein [Rhodovibrionaceae bacterium]
MANARLRGTLRSTLIAAAGFLGTLGGPAGDTLAQESVSIFAASSTTEAVEEAALACSQDTGIAAKTVFAASSTLARQIAKGAPADIFISANSRWMDILRAGHFVAETTRRDLLANALVLIAHRETEIPELDLEDDPPLADLLQDTRLAMGDPAHVPAGIYARAALVKLGLWPDIAERTAPAANVRAALALVARGEARLGVVYATDAQISDAVEVVARFPPASHPPIRYPAAIVAGRLNPRVEAFFACLTSEKARRIFQHHGFDTPDDSG